MNYDYFIASRYRNKEIVLNLAARVPEKEEVFTFLSTNHLILIGEQEAAKSLYLIFNEVFSGVDDFISTL